MDVLIVTVFVSLILVIAGLVLFVTRLRQGDFEHGDRLSLLPLEEDEVRAADSRGTGSRPSQAEARLASPQETAQETQQNPEQIRVAE